MQIVSDKAERAAIFLLHQLHAEIFHDILTLRQNDIIFPLQRRVGKGKIQKNDRKPELQKPRNIFRLKKFNADNAVHLAVGKVMLEPGKGCRIRNAELDKLNIIIGQILLNPAQYKNIIIDIHEQPGRKD